MLTFQQEIFRKLIHVLYSIVPISIYFYGKSMVLKFLVPISIVFIFLDFFRSRQTILTKYYNIFFSYITRDFEEKRLTGASHILLSSCIIICFLEINLAVASLLIMSISDALAALVGKKYGSIIIGEKTLEGSIAFFLSSITIIIFTNLNLSIAIFSTFIATYIELRGIKKIDDNLTVPISFSFSYLIVAYTINGSILIGIS